MSAQAMADVIKARRKDIREQAPCESCGSTLAACKAGRGKDPTAPPWFGCCARGVMADIPCRHRTDPDALAALLDEIESGAVRTVEEIAAERAARVAERASLRAAHTTPDGRLLTLADKFGQGDWWRAKDGQWLRITEMDERHRRNTAAMLLRRAAVYAGQVAWSEFGTLTGPLGGAPEDVVDEVLRDQERRDADPEGWVRGTPLYRALVAGIPAEVPA